MWRFLKEWTFYALLLIRDTDILSRTLLILTLCCTGRRGVWFSPAWLRAELDTALSDNRTEFEFAQSGAERILTWRKSEPRWLCLRAVRNRAELVAVGYWTEQSLNLCSWKSERSLTLGGTEQSRYWLCAVGFWPISRFMSQIFARYHLYILSLRLSH